MKQTLKPYKPAPLKEVKGEAKRVNLPEKLLALPGEESWELWSSNSSSSNYQYIQKTTPADLEKKDLASIALPAQSAHAIPIWIPSTDKNIIQSAITLHLEKTNLQPKDPESKLIDTQIIETKDNNTLALLSILHPEKATQLGIHLNAQYHISPQLYTFPKNQIILWEELGSYVVAITREEQLLYYQNITARSLEKDAAIEIHCILRDLQFQQLITPLTGITLWLPSAPENFCNELEKSTALPITLAQRPDTIHTPKDSSSIIPPEVEEGRKKRTFHQRIRKLASWLLIFYCIAIVLAGAQWFFLKYQANRREEGITKLKEKSGWILEESARWKALEPALDEKNSRLELLLKISQLFPPEGIRLVSLSVEPFSQRGEQDLFSATPDIVRIMGEASNQAMALKFANDIPRTITEYTWETPKPTPLRGGSSYRFHIIGKHKETTPKQEE